MEGLWCAQQGKLLILVVARAPPAPLQISIGAQRDNLRIVIWNVNGIGNAAKQLEVVKAIRARNPDLILLSDIRWVLGPGGMHPDTGLADLADSARRTWRTWRTRPGGLGGLGGLRLADKADSEGGSGRFGGLDGGPLADLADCGRPIWRTVHFLPPRSGCARGLGRSVGNVLGVRRVACSGTPAAGACSGTPAAGPLADSWQTCRAASQPGGLGGLGGLAWRTWRTGGLVDLADLADTAWRTWRIWRAPGGLGNLGWREARAAGTARGVH
eukprot:gene16773-biopygen8036